MYGEPLNQENAANTASSQAAANANQAEEQEQQQPLGQEQAQQAQTQTQMTSNNINDMDSVILPESGSEGQQQIAADTNQEEEITAAIGGWGDQHIGVVMHPAGQPSMLDEANRYDDDENDDDGDEDNEATVISQRNNRNRRQQEANSSGHNNQNMLVDESVEASATAQEAADNAEDHQVAQKTNETSTQKHHQQRVQEATQQQQQPIAVENVDPERIVQFVQNIILKCNAINQTIKGHQEPTDEIIQVTDKLRQNKRYVLYAMDNIMTSEQTKELILSWHGMANAMLEEHIILSSNYLLAIFQFFHCLIVEYYPEQLHNLEMCSLAESLLKERASLYQTIMPPQLQKNSRRNAVQRNVNQQQDDEKKREELRGVLNFESEQRTHQRIQEEAEFREGLKVGDYLDALARYSIPQTNSNFNFIVGWAHARVLEVDAKGMITIGFLGRGKEHNLNRLSLMSDEIAPFNKFTHSMQWKEDLVEGSLLDACDDYGVWYKSTLVRKYFDEQKLDCDNNPIEIFHIACRYPDPEGTKTKDGIKVTGWLRDDFDLHVEKTAPCLRPFSHYTTQYFDVSPEAMKYDVDVQDQIDVQFQTDQIQTFARYRDSQFGGIKFVGTIIDEFGKNRGFDKILALFEKVSSGALKLTVEHISYVMIFLATTMPFWTREFMCTSMNNMVEKFQAAMGTSHASNPLILTHTRGHINILINNYHSFLRRYYVARKHHRMVNYMNSLIGCSLLKLENLEKRIFGIKLISDQIGNLPYMDHSMRKKEEIVEDLKTLKAFEIIFSSKNYHQQILQRAEDVLRLFAQTSSLTEGMIDLLWETRQMDETACISVYTIIGECIYGMQKDIVSYFIDKIKEIAPQSLQLRDVELIYNIGKSSTNAQQSKYCADALWNVIFQQKTGYSQQVLKVSRKSLCDLMRSFDTNTKIDFINRCVDHVSDPTVVSLQVLKIMFKTISWLPKPSTNNFPHHNPQITMKGVVTELVQDSQLIDILLQDLEAYKSTILQEWQPDNLDDLNVFSPRTIEIFPLLSEGFTHSKNLEVRLNGIQFILESLVINGPRVQANHLQRLWDILIVNTKLPGDQKAFFGFLRRVLQERDWLDPVLVCKFFEEKIEQNPQLVEGQISLDAFQSIQSMFLYVNEYQNFISIIKLPIEEKKLLNEFQFGGKTGITRKRLKNQQQGRYNDWTTSNNSSSNKNNNQTQKVKLEFRVHVHPNQLRGIEILWILFRNAPSRDLDLLSQVVHFLAQVYHSISRVLEDQRKMIYSDFVQESLRRLKDQLELDNDQFGGQKKDLVKNTMQMLVHSFGDTEINGSAAIRPHFNIDQPSQTIEEITVQTCIPTKPGQPSYFSFSVDSKITVWEFIDFIARQLNLSPRNIKVQRNVNSMNQQRNSKKPDFNAYSHCMTLSQMMLENGDEIQIRRNINQNIDKVQIINPQTKEMVPDVRQIFEQWFDTFATPREKFEDAAELTEEKYMDKDACAEFMNSTIKDSQLQNQRNQESFQMRDNFIAKIYNEYDVDDDGRLTKEDFLRFYHQKCKDSDNIVRQNLEKHNFGPDLLPRSDIIELTYNNDDKITQNHEDLPRYFISANQEQFNSLFDLESYFRNASPQCQQETMESVWHLIGRLKTNPQLYLSFLRNENLEERLGSQSNTSHQSYRLLYFLQIIYCLLNNYRSKSQNTVALYIEKNQRPQLWGNNSGAPGQINVRNIDYDRQFPAFEESKNNDNGGGSKNHLDQIMEDDSENHRENILGLVNTRNNGAVSYPEDRQRGKYTQQAPNNIMAGSGEPIALQDAATVENENRQAIQNNNLTDRFGKQMTHAKKQIQNWKGEIVHEQLNVNQVSDQELMTMIQTELNQVQEQANLSGQEVNMLEHPEMLQSPAEILSELKSKWLVDFISKSGFNYLIQIMKTIVQRNLEVDKLEILSKKAEVNSLRLAAQLIKVILVSCFCSQTQDLNLVGNLQRKMSSVNDIDPLQKNNDSQPVNRAQNDLISKQQDITNEFKMLTDLFSQEPDAANQLLQNVNLTDLQDLLQYTLRIILKKQSLINDLDRQVVAECLDIWVSCITFQNELLLNIYGQDENQSTEIVTMLIEQGIFSETASLRKQFKEAIQFMSFNIKTGTLPIAPAIFFMKKLLGQIDHCKQLSYTRTPDFFDLLVELMNHYFNMEQREPMNFKVIFEPASLIKDFIQQLDLYKSQESKTSIVADHTLVGIIRLAQTLLQANGDILDQAECSNIMTMLIRNCLFNQAQEAYPGHITSSIDLSTHLSNQVNKCHTDESRNAAYSLLDTVLNSNSDPRLIQKLVEEFWSPFILQLSKQKEAGVAPQDSGRSPYKFAGIKNLGCICYMNSMLQQLFCVPQFRYSLLATDDRVDQDWKLDAQGNQVDNNSLHQWLKMFSFLQMTDRQEYNPTQFCFAFKQLNGDPTNVRVQQDAQEFLNLGFDRLEFLLKDTPQKYICQSVFEGKMTGLTVCKNCGNIVCTDQPFYTLSLQVKNQKTLQSSLESMIAGEKIDDYNCSACKKKVTIEKKQCIRNMPNTLIVHLNRIVFDFDTMRNVKLNDKLEFPNHLSVKQFMLHQVLADMKKNDDQSKLDQQNSMNIDRHESVKNQNGDENEESRNAQQPSADNANQAEDQPIEDEEEKKAREEENQRLQELVKEGQKIPTEEFDYKLVGVVIHMGMADAGHYISYINIERGGYEFADSNRAEWLQTDKQTWLEFNDSIVSNFDFTQMPFKAFGEEESGGVGSMIDYNDMDTVQNFQKSHNAYMLVYEKAQKKPLKLVCSPENINLIKSQPKQVIQKFDQFISSSTKSTSTLSCDGTAISREQQPNQQQIITTSTSNNDENQGSLSRLSTVNTQADTEMASSSEQLSAAKQQISSQSEDTNNVKEIEEFLAKVPHSFMIYPGLVAQLYENPEAVLKYDEEKKEYYADVPFNNVQQFVPNQYYRQVHEDNQLFLAEKQVFCTPFFKTSAQMIEQYLDSIDQEAAYVHFEETQKKRLQIFKVIDKLIFDMIVNGTEQQQQNLAQITVLLFRVIDQSPEALFSIINDRILVGIDDPNNQDDPNSQQKIDTSGANNKPKTLEDKIFFDMLVTGRTIQVRDLAEQVLTNVMDTLFKKLSSCDNEDIENKRQIEELINKIMMELLALIPLEVQKFWHKLGPFFNFFYNMVKEPHDINKIGYLIRSGLVHRLIDLTGRYNSQVEYSVPPFDKLVTTVCILARSQPLLIYLFGIPDQFQVTDEEIRQQINVSPISPHWIYYQPENPELQYQLGMPMLSVQDLRSLNLCDKRSKEFFSVALKNTQESKNVATLIGHLCWGNYEASRRFGKLILKGLNNTNELEVKPYVDCMMTYLSLDDQFQEERVEWLMGVAFYRIQRGNHGSYDNKNKAGLNLITHIDDMIVEYESTLFKTKAEIEESVLRMMYKYRKERFVRAALALLEGVSWVMAHADKNNVLLKHLLTIEPPAYTCRRYWDWIEPHIREHIQNCSDNIHLATSSEELETSMRIFSNIEVIKSQYGDLLTINENNTNELVENGACGRPIPDPYLIWELPSDQQLAIYPENENAKVKVSIHDCCVKVSKSRPTGTDNESVQRGWSNSRISFTPRQFRKQPRKATSSSYGRGSRAAAAARMQNQKDSQDRKNRWYNGGNKAGKSSQRRSGDNKKSKRHHQQQEQYGPGGQHPDDDDYDGDSQEADNSNDGSTNAAADLESGHSQHYQGSIGAGGDQVMMPQHQQNPDPAAEDASTENLANNHQPQNEDPSVAQQNDLRDVTDPIQAAAGTTTQQTTTVNMFESGPSKNIIRQADDDDEDENMMEGLGSTAAPVVNVNTADNNNVNQHQNNQNMVDQNPQQADQQVVPNAQEAAEDNDADDGEDENNGDANAEDYCSNTNNNQNDEEQEETRFDNSASAQQPYYEGDGSTNNDQRQNMNNPYVIENQDGDDEGEVNVGQVQNDDQNPAAEAGPTDDDGDELVQDPKTEEYALLVFLFNNQDRRDVKITIIFNQQNRGNVNFRQPVTDYTETITPKNNKLSLTFGKVKLGQNWGKLFDWRVIINGIDVMTDQKWDKYEKDHPLLRNAKIPFIIAAEQERANQDQDIQDDGQQYQSNNMGGGDAPADSGADGGPNDGQISCPACTFFNPPYNTQCEICQTAL